MGARKGFDVAVIDQEGLVAGPTRLPDSAAVAVWLGHRRPRVIAVDSPRRPAPDAQLSRPCERSLAKARLCGIRYTPDRSALEGNPAYYAWIENGFDLYSVLASARPAIGWRELIECFPTASWSRLGGPRRGRSRARWSQEVLSSVALRGVPNRMNQDARDAIGAALTARLHEEGQTEAFGEIVVPAGS